MKYIASVSWGKDSTAMLLILIKKHYKLDEDIIASLRIERKPISNGNNDTNY